jgi:hypothetical protein
MDMDTTTLNDLLDKALNYKGLLGKQYQTELWLRLSELNDYDFADWLRTIKDLREARLIAALNLPKAKYFFALRYYKELREKQK